MDRERIDVTGLLWTWYLAIIAATCCPGTQLPLAAQPAGWQPKP